MAVSAVVLPAFNEETRIDLTLAALSLQDRSSDHTRHIVVVDNDSTDGTVERVLSFGKSCGDFVLHLIDEQEKGTGAACDTGFRYAIDNLGAEVIGRLDADTVPSPGWMFAIEQRFRRRPKTALLTGPVSAGFDGGPTFFELNLLPRIKTAGKIIKIVQYQSLGMWRFAPGHNMATTRDAYNRVGGFTRSNIVECSEDVQFSLAIAKEFGITKMGYSWNMLAFTSQRRLRELGLWGSARYYLSENAERRALVTNRNPDIR